MLQSFTRPALILSAFLVLTTIQACSKCSVPTFGASACTEKTVR